MPENDKKFQVRHLGGHPESHHSHHHNHSNHSSPIKKSNFISFKKYNPINDQYDIHEYDMEKHPIANEIHKSISSEFSKSIHNKVEKGTSFVSGLLGISSIHPEGNLGSSTSQLLKSENYRHSDKILAVAIYVPRFRCVRYCNKKNCDCKPMVVTSSWDKTIIIWDLKTGISLRLLQGHTKAGLNLMTVLFLYK